MALCHFPPLFTLIPSFPKCNKKTHLKWETQRYPLPRTLDLSCSAEKSSKSKGRASKPTKSNEELCIDLREFISAAGFPENHVPSTKDLTNHGRKDLANIVRRRGYKLITELLQNSRKVDSYSEEPPRDQVPSDSCRDELAGSHILFHNFVVQEKNPIESAEYVPLSNSFLEGKTNGALVTNIYLQSCKPSEPPIESLQLKAADFIETGELDMLEVQEKNPIESAEYVSLSNSFLEGKTTNSALVTSIYVQSCKPSEPPIESLQLKAADFIETGELDMLEDASDVKNLNLHTDSGYESGILSTSDTDTAYMTSQVASTVAEDRTDGDLVTSGNMLFGADFDEHMTTEMDSERNNQAEIDHLKTMLRQKEMELSELKQQVEKEKQAMCILQVKANTEIGNVQAITQEDVEIQAIEEGLSGLKEVQIEYWGNGETVEISGSFNGWHHQIKMDPRHSSKTISQPVSGSLKLWSTILWLYPGVYEIKFIVDGNWRLDSNLEMITSGNITNNVLKVDR